MNSRFNFETVFFITTKALRFNRSHPFLEKNVYWMVQFSLILLMVISCCVLLVNSSLFHDLPAGNFTEVCKNGTMAIVALTIVVKYYFLLYFQSDIKTLIQIMDKDYENFLELNAEERGIIIKYVSQGTRVSKYWWFSITLTSLIFPLRALILMGYSYWKGDFKFIPMFDLVWPEYIDKLKDTPLVFWALFSVNLVFTFYACSMYLSFDPLMPIFLLHICGQLDILSSRMMNVFSDNSTLHEINKNLKEINVKLQDLFSIVHNLENNYTIIYEFILKTTTFLLPLTAFQVAEDLRQHRVNLEFISFFVACMLQFYIPCYYSNFLLERSEYLRSAIYSCGWERHCNIGARKTVLIMLTRTAVPLALKTIFCLICLDSFAEMCRQAFAIFNIMNAVWG